MAEAPKVRPVKFEWTDVVAASDLPTSTKCLAFYLAHKASADGTNVRPGQALMAAAISSSESTVRRAIATLLDRGYLAKVKKGHYTEPGVGRPNEYRLAIPTQRAPVTGDPVEIAHGQRAPVTGDHHVGW